MILVAVGIEIPLSDSEERVKLGNCLWTISRQRHNILYKQAHTNHQQDSNLHFPQREEGYTTGSLSTQSAASFMYSN